MRRFIVAAVLLAAVGALSAPGVASAQSTLPPRIEVEPNNSIAAPDPVPVLTDTAIRGSIAPVGDEDFFRVVVSQQASVRFETFVPDRPTCTPAVGASSDTVIRLFNANGVPIGFDNNSGEGQCSLLVVALEPGTYFIAVDESRAGDAIPAYTLEIDFTPDQVPPGGCPADDDEDGDGLIDSRERLLSTLLANPDSDRDGIRDGNDDANGDGEDDEDEDDDDDCPDEDSDGDGEDDEDEDDDEDDEDD